ncbi:major facilitator superfamily domain-containing protein [Apiosordaria backusii]|uniref:Major facilitator superfamily domain-containing protein n=1 Tax=Apiosordaria backusii TaxID=314023 RepID=A0AA40EZN8_9PEZI|nr:major facilitator superfamily domain-containing protein [Apiosordaria backusii]
MDVPPRTSSQYDEDDAHHRPSFQSFHDTQTTIDVTDQPVEPVTEEEKNDESAAESEIQIEKPQDEDAVEPVEPIEPEGSQSQAVRAFPLVRTSLARPPSTLRPTVSTPDICQRVVSPDGSVRRECSLEVLDLSRDEVRAIMAASRGPKSRGVSMASTLPARNLGESNEERREELQVPDQAQPRCPTCRSILVGDLDLAAFAPVQQQTQYLQPPTKTTTKSSSLRKSPPNPTPFPYYASSHATSDDDEEMIVSWEPDHDPGNPYNWSSGKKASILITCMMLIVNSTMGSALPANALPFITGEWNVTNQQQQVLPISVYLIGYVMGPILWAPLSEQFGRKILTMVTFLGFTAFTLATALAPTWITFLIFRLLTGTFASAPIAIVPGIIADMSSDPRSRGRNMGLFFMTTVSGPLLAPIISGYCSETIGWRWAFWIGLIYAGCTLIPLFFLPETYGPILLKRRAQEIRRHDPKARVVALHELEKKSFKELTTVVLYRPIKMLFTEPIVNTSCAYLALCYAIFYMCFEAFPLIFIGVYGLSPGECGLTYLAIGAGCLLALPIFFVYDSILRSAMAKNKPWTRQEEYRRLPLACIGGPMFVVSLFWLGWTAREGVPFFVPMLAGVPFGVGFMCIFQALLNYLTDAYSIYAASANAAASTSRSLLATVLPLATLPMFEKLGISGACSLLGGVSTLMCVIPFVFLWQGDRIRGNSKFCIAIWERKVEQERKIQEQRRRSQARLLERAQQQGEQQEKEVVAVEGSGSEGSSGSESAGEGESSRGEGVPEVVVVVPEVTVEVTVEAVGGNGGNRD